MHLTVRISEDLSARLNDAVEKSDQSKSDFVRDAIIAKLPPKKRKIKLVLRK